MASTRNQGNVDDEQHSPNGSNKIMAAGQTTSSKDSPSSSATISAGNTRPSSPIQSSSMAMAGTLSSTCGPTTLPLDLPSMPLVSATIPNVAVDSADNSYPSSTAPVPHANRPAQVHATQRSDATQETACIRITREDINARIQTLLFDTLAWAAPQIATVASVLTARVIQHGTWGHLGPFGISSVKDIFMVVGHVGTKRYMAMAVTSPSPLRLLLRGDPVDTEGKNPMEDKKSMQMLEVGFHNAAFDEWRRADLLNKGTGRWRG